MDQNQNNNQGNNLSTYDRLISALEGLPDVTKTQPSTIRVVTPLIGTSQTFIVQTVRQKDMGDHVFLEIVDSSGAIRVVLPPTVSIAIARQRDALVTKVRRKVGKRVMQERIASGEKVGFQKGHRIRRKKG